MGIETSAKEILENILTKIGFEAEVTSMVQGEGLVLKINSPESGVLIGHHGENLMSLQTILRGIIYRLTGEWHPILVDVGGYRAERTQKLQEMATRSAERARFLHDEVVLPPMTASDRREVHVAVAEIEGVQSESVGEGMDRHVVIRPE